MKKSFLIIFILAVFFCFFAPACSRKSDEPPIFNGQTINKLSLMVAYNVPTTGKASYAVVNRDWVLWAYDDYRKWLGSGAYGVTKWDDRSQCTLFATAFEVYCQLAFFRQGFHSDIQAKGIAVGTVWYFTFTPMQQGMLEGHAVNQIITQNGMEYFEPQTGKFIQLTDGQRLSTYFSKFD